MLKVSLLRFAVPIFATALLSSCGSNPEKETKTVDTVAVSKNAELLNIIDDLIIKLPRPSEIPNLIAMTGAEFEEKLLNPIENGEKVLGDASKAAFNIGVFGADVGYLAAYEKGTEASKIFVVTKKLADKVGVSAAFDPSIVARLEKNLERKDSLIVITDASLAKSASILKANEQIKDAALVITGAFVEGLYLNCGLIHDYPPTGLPKAEQDKILVPLVSSVIKQEGALASVIDLLKNVNNGDEVTTSLITKLESALAIYKKADWPKKLAENNGSLIPTEKDIHELAIAISEIRNELTR
jgi:hypothetical protein